MCLLPLGAMQAGFMGCLVPLGAMQLCLLLLKLIRTFNVSLGPLCPNWCKVTAALWRWCERQGRSAPPEPSSPSNREHVRLRQPGSTRSMPLCHRVLPDRMHSSFTPRFTRGPVKKEQVPNLADEGRDMTGPGGTETWLRISHTRE